MIRRNIETIILLLLFVFMAVLFCCSCCAPRQQPDDLPHPRDAPQTQRWMSNDDLRTSMGGDIHDQPSLQVFDEGGGMSPHGLVSE